MDKSYIELHAEQLILLLDLQVSSWSFGKEYNGKDNVNRLYVITKSMHALW